MSRLIAKITYPEAIHLMSLILLQCRNSRDSMMELDWKQYPFYNFFVSLIANLFPTNRRKIVTHPFIFQGESLHIFLICKSFSLYSYQLQDIESLYTLFDQICISKISPISLLESLLACLPETQSFHPDVTLVGDKLDQVHLQHIHWIVGVLPV